MLGCFPYSRIHPPKDDDLISYSPSLSHIFSFLDIDDVVHCQLVSRRWNRIMSRESKKLRGVHLEINFHQSDKETASITLSSRSKTTIHISERRIRLSKKKLPCLYKIYRHKGRRFKEKIKLIRDEFYNWETKEAYLNEMKTNCIREFHVDEFHNEFRTILSYILSKYSLKSISLSISPYAKILRNQMISLVIELLLDFAVKCDIFSHNENVTQLEFFYHILGCTHIGVPDCVAAKTMLMNTNRLVKCPISACLADFEPVFDIIQKWTKSETRIIYWILYNSYSHCHNKRNWQISYFRRKFERMDHISITVHENEAEFEVVISRPIDSIVLRFYLSNLKEVIEIHEVASHELPIQTPTFVNRSFQFSPKLSQ